MDQEPPQPPEHEAPVGPPRSLVHSCRCAWPPTKKNTGMTWSSQVRIHRLSVKPSGLLADGPSLRQTTIVNTQCHMTTMSRLNARHRSMKSSRSERAVGSSAEAATALMVASRPAGSDTR